MRLSPNGTNWRVSSSVDQTTCATPARLAACAMALASAFSRSGDMCAQKNDTQYAPCAPLNARSRLARSSASATTTSAPNRASSRAAGASGFLVIARTANPPAGSLKMARTRPPPCEPVAPTTAMMRAGARRADVPRWAGALGAAFLATDVVFRADGACFAFLRVVAALDAGRFDFDVVLVLALVVARFAAGIRFRVLPRFFAAMTPSLTDT